MLRVASITPEEKRRRIEQRLRGDTQDLPNARDSEYDPAVYEILRANPKLMGHVETWMDTAQVLVIEDALKEGLDTSKLNNPNLNWMQMNAIREYLKEGIDITEYTNGDRNDMIMRQVGEAIKQGMTDSEIKGMLKLKNWSQMREVRLGYKLGLNVDKYNDSNIEWKTMQRERLRQRDDTTPKASYKGVSSTEETKHKKASDFPDLKRDGNCYVVAYRTFTRFYYTPNSYLVHGVVRGRGNLNGIYFSHAWVEVGDLVYDGTTTMLGGEIPKDVYYKLGDVREAPLFKYNRDRTIDKALEYETYGPWEPEFEEYL